jgi:hypothetical protein
MVKVHTHIKCKRYFVWDLINAQLSFWIFHRRDYFSIEALFAVIHFIGHLFFVLTWDGGFLAEEIRQWSAANPDIPWFFSIHLVATVIDIGFRVLMFQYICRDFLKYLKDQKFEEAAAKFSAYQPPRIGRRSKHD